MQITKVWALSNLMNVMLDFGKNDFMLCENAMKKYPTV